MSHGKTWYTLAEAALKHRQETFLLRKCAEAGALRSGKTAVKPLQANKDYLEDSALESRGFI